MKAFITGTTEEGLIFIKTSPEEAKNLTTDMEVDISINVKVANPLASKKEDDIRVFHFTDYNDDTRVVKMTRKQHDFLRQLAEMDYDEYIRLSDWEEGYPETDDFTQDW